MSFDTPQTGSDLKGEIQSKDVESTAHFSEN
jgi:hypothetical protein